MGALASPMHACIVMAGSFLIFYKSNTFVYLKIYESSSVRVLQRFKDWW